MFNIKTSDKVPSGYIFCIKESVFGKHGGALTRKLLSVPPIVGDVGIGGGGCASGDSSRQAVSLADRWL